MAQYFNLTLDQLAPQNGLITLEDFYKDNDQTFSMSADDAYFLKVIFNKTETATMADFANISWEVYSTAHEAHATDFSLGDGTYYVHAIFMDDLGNVGPIVTASTVYDTVAPTISSVDVSSKKSVDPTGHTTDANVKVRVTVSDATSGVEYVTLAGDITQTGDAAKFIFTDEDRAAGYKDCDVTLTPLGEGSLGETRTVSAVATDFSGNNSGSVSGTIEYDASAGEFTSTLYKSDLSAPLPAYVKELPFAVRVDSCPADIVKYEVKDGATSLKEAAVTEGTTTFDITGLNLNDLDGLHTITIILTDDAGNTVEDSHTVNLDRVAPEVTVSYTPSLISDKTGFNTVTFTIAGTDGHFDANVTYHIDVQTGVDEWKEVASDTVASTDSQTKVNDTKEVNESAIVAQKALPAAGYANDYVFRVRMSDAAQMEGVSAATAALQIDTAGPTQTVGTAPEFSNDSTGVAVTGWTAAEVGYSTVANQYIWVTNSSEAETSVPAGARKEAYANGSIKVTSADGLTEGANYIHVAAVDALENIGTIVVSSKIVYDLTKPTLDVTVPTGTVTSRSQTLPLIYSDAKGDIEVSGVDYVLVWGDIEGHSTEATALKVFAPVTEAAVTLVENTTAGTETKNIYAKAVDKAGNESDQVQKTIKLETGTPDVEFKLYDANDATEITGARRNVPGFIARIKANDEEADLAGYKLWGDLKGGPATEPTDWTTPYPGEEGVWVSLAAKECTTDSEGTKTFYVKVKDVNGNIGEANASFIYDTTAAVITVDNVDYNRISLVHEVRKDSVTGSEITGTYDDMMTFDFKSDSNLTQYKVCVNHGAESQEEIEAADAIGTSHGSLNMAQGTGATVVVEENVTISCTIMGADFAETEEVNYVDGAYEVIVYGKDEAGTWSAGHAFTIPPRTKATATAVDKDGQPVTVNIINGEVPQAAKDSAPDGAATMSFGTNNDITKVEEFTLTADVSELELAEGDTVDVYHYE